MRSLRLTFTGTLVAVALAVAPVAGQTAASASSAMLAAVQAQQQQTQTQKPPAQTQTQKPPAQGQQPPATGKETEDVKYKETVVVSASKTEQQLVNAPVTMTVIGPATFETAPSTSYGDLLRAVPGVNVSQLSARDVNVTSRGATSSLATSQLAVVDGRSIYQDFFGFVMWDFMPANPNEIKQMEVIRGPASAVWGANALNGVINVITKSPREMQGAYVTFGGGAFGREVDGFPSKDMGSVWFANATYANAPNDRWSYKIGAGTYSSDAFARPQGTIPNGTGTPYPPYENQGTAQPKFDARVDYDRPDNKGRLSFSGGVGGTDGIMQSGIGPFDIQGGTTMSYGKATYSKGAQRLQVFVNHLDGDAKNLLSVDQTGQPINFIFKTTTFDVEYGDTKPWGTKQALTYGGNFRYNGFDLTIAPGENSRTEGGAYIQDEIFLNDRYRVVAGLRVDKFSSINDAVLSPRVAFLVKANADHSFRVSYNRAFRSPSMINNNLDVTIAQPIPMDSFCRAPLPPGCYGGRIYLLPVDADGYKDLTETRLDAFEIGYTGTIKNRAVVSAAWFFNVTKDDIFFTQTGTYPISPAPPGFPDVPGLPGSGAQIWAAAYQLGPLRLPSSYSYRNLGTVDQTGFELGINTTLVKNISMDLNYSYQPDPNPDFDGLTEEQALAEINIPPNNRFNLGFSYNGARYFGNVNMNYVGEAFWQDVLDARYSGTTKAYTALNLSAGVRFHGSRYALVFKATNLLDEQIMQHIFGDIIRRQLMGELRINLPK